jgi:16S rRNA (cytosine1402-N4)-methyltransferase
MEAPEVECFSSSCPAHHGRRLKWLMSDPVPVHVPVMLREVVHWLEPRDGAVIVDGTLGGGGHARALAERVGPTGMVIGIDRDPAVIDAAGRNLAGLPMRIVQANYCDLPEVLESMELTAVDGILLDLGVSSDQLADRERGFSFSADGPLDLRFDPTTGEPTWRLVNRLSAEKLADLIYKYGEERYSRRIARAIVRRRQGGPIKTSGELAEVVRRSVPRSPRFRRLDPATRTFQALRIAANDELKSLEIALRRMPGSLRPGGRLAVISFHSLEDRPVKEAFRDEPCYEVLTKKPLRPTPDEVAGNLRARSAKLRVAARAVVEC